MWVCIGHESFRDLRESWRLEREIFWREGKKGRKGKIKKINGIINCARTVSVIKDQTGHFVKPLDA